MAAVDLDRLVVVLGSRADEALAEVDLHGAEPVVCDRWCEGQSVSLAYGLAQLDDERGPGRLPRRLWWPSATSRTLRRRRCGGCSPRAARRRRSGPPTAESAPSGRPRARAAGSPSRGDRRRGCPRRPAECGAREVPCDDLGGGEDVDTPGAPRGPALAGQAMRLEQSFEVQAPLEWCGGRADRRRARGAMPARCRDHRGVGRRHLPRKLHREARPHHGLLSRRAEDGDGGRAGTPGDHARDRSRTSAGRAPPRPRS